MGRLDEFLQGSVWQFRVHQIPGSQRHNTRDIADIPAVHRQPVIATPAYQGNSTGGIPVAVDRCYLGNRNHGLANRGFRKTNDTLDADTVKDIHIRPAFGHVHHHAHLFPGNKNRLLGFAAPHEARTQTGDA